MGLKITAIIVLGVVLAGLITWILVGVGNTYRETLKNREHADPFDPLLEEEMDDPPVYETTNTSPSGIDLGVDLTELPHSGWLAKDERINNSLDVLDLLIQDNITTVHGISEERAQDIFKALPVDGEFTFEDGRAKIKNFEIYA